MSGGKQGEFPEVFSADRPYGIKKQIMRDFRIGSGWYRFCQVGCMRNGIGEQVDWAGVPLKSVLEKDLVPAVKSSVMNLPSRRVDGRLGAGKIAEIFGSAVFCIVMWLQEEAGTGLGEQGDRTAQGRVLAEGVIMNVPKVGKSAQGISGGLFKPFCENSRVSCLLGIGIVQSYNCSDMGKNISGVGATG